MLRSLVALLLFVALPASLAAQTVDEVVAKYLAARGGLERVKATTSLRMNGRLTVGSGPAGPFSMELKRPGKLRVEFLLDGQRVVQAYDGTKGWMVNPFAGIPEAQVQPPGEPRDLAEQADIDGPLLDYRAKGMRLDLLGKTALGGSEAFKLRLTLRNGIVRFIFIDAKSGHIVRAEERRRMGEADVSFVNTFSDHRKVDGLVLPYRVESAPEGSSENQVLVFDTIEVNTPIEEARFAVPAGAKPAAKPVDKP